jgi:hypoxanthine phosphoribosyltransferase
MLKVDNKIYLSWDDLNSLVDELCEKIPFETPLVDSVCGIARGGLIPAVMVSHKMGLPYTDVIGKNTLVIDDIADTGLTLEKAPGVYTAVLHYKPHTSCFKPNVWAQEHTSDEWVIYPWEKKDSAQIQDYLVSSK